MFPVLAKDPRFLATTKEMKQEDQILKKILSYVNSPKTLIRCLEVSRPWNRAAQQIIQNTLLIPSYRPILCREEFRQKLKQLVKNLHPSQMLYVTAQPFTQNSKIQPKKPNEFYGTVQLNFDTVEYHPAIEYKVNLDEIVPPQLIEPSTSQKRITLRPSDKNHASIYSYSLPQDFAETFIREIEEISQERLTQRNQQEGLSQKITQKAGYLFMLYFLFSLFYCTYCSPTS